MKKRILIALVSMCWMPGVYAQDSVAVKMDLIDEYRANILAHKNEFLSVGFPLSWYADTDSIFYYFKDKHLVLIEHSSDKEIDGDTNVVRAIAYKRVFFLETGFVWRKSTRKVMRNIIDGMRIKSNL